MRLFCRHKSVTRFQCEGVINPLIGPQRCGLTLSICNGCSRVLGEMFSFRDDRPTVRAR